MAHRINPRAKAVRRLSQIGVLSKLAYTTGGRSYADAICIAVFPEQSWNPGPILQNRQKYMSRMRHDDHRCVQCKL